MSYDIRGKVWETYVVFKDSFADLIESVDFNDWYFGAEEDFEFGTQEDDDDLNRVIVDAALDFVTKYPEVVESARELYNQQYPSSELTQDEASAVIAYMVTERCKKKIDSKYASYQGEEWKRDPKKVERFGSRASAASHGEDDYMAKAEASYPELLSNVIKKIGLQGKGSIKS